MINEIKQLLAKCIENSDYEKAYELVKGFLNTDIEYDEEILYLMSIVAESRNLYGVARAYLEMAHRINSQNENINNSLMMFSNGETEYRYKKDYSCRNKRLRIIAIVNAFPILDDFAEQLIASYEMMGHEVYRLDYALSNIDEGCKRFISGGVDIFLSLNNKFAKFGAGDKLLTDVLGCKVVNILVDHPLNMMQNMKNKLSSDKIYQFVVDKDHLKYLKNHEFVQCNNYFMPHGGAPRNREILPLNMRSTDVLYVGSPKMYYKSGDQFIDECIDLMINNPNECARDIVKKHIKEVYGDNGEAQFTQDDIDKIQAGELVALGYYRTKTVEMLLEKGINVEVHGPGWDMVPFANHPNLHIGELISPPECVDLMYDVKVVLNSMPWFKDGTHERIFNGMLAGALVVTDKSKWLEENMESGRELILFNLEKMDEFADNMKNIIDNIEDYQEIANTGYLKAVAEHTWSHRALDILNCIDVFS